MSEVPHDPPDGGPAREASDEERQATGSWVPQPEGGDPQPGPEQPQPGSQPGEAEWWRIGSAPPTPAAQPTPPWGTPPPGAMPGWGPPPWAGATPWPPQWYGWGPGAPGGPPTPPGSGSSSSRRHPFSWVVVGAILATLAMVALGVGIGYTVWGGSSSPASARQGQSSPAPRISPFTGVGGTRVGGGAPFGGVGGRSGEGFLGVDIATTSKVTKTSGAHVEGVVASSPAAKAGIVKGDTITELDTRAVTSARTLEIDVIGLSPGTKVKVAWVTSTGRHESATVTLVSRPVTSSTG